LTRIPSLDGIRAFSFMLVFVAHSGFAGLVPEGMLRGDLGVTIFFFLSGFIITTLLRAEFEQQGSVNIAHFWLRRALRILPPLYLTVLMAVLMTLALYPTGTMRFDSVVSELLFYSNYGLIYRLPDREPPGMDVVWSLAVEEHFYLLFPLLYAGMLKLRMSARRQAMLLWGICAAILAWRCMLFTATHASTTRIYFATDTRVDSILFCCALAVWNNPVLDKPPRELNRWMCVLFPAALAVMLACLAYHDEVFSNTGYFSVQGVALTVLFIGAVRYNRIPPFRLLNWRPVVYVGVLSYPLYLVHNVFGSATGRLWPYAHQWQRAAIALSASVVAAWILHEAIEKPCARLRKRLAHQGPEPVGSRSSPGHDGTAGTGAEAAVK